MREGLERPTATVAERPGRPAAATRTGRTAEMRGVREGRGDPMGPVLVSAALLAGGIAAAVAAAAVRLAPEESPRIASVRLGDLTAGYATHAAERGDSPEDVRAWGAALERALQEVAERRGAVLLCGRRRDGRRRGRYRTGFEIAAIIGGVCIDPAIGKVLSVLVQREFLANVLAAPIRWNPGAVE